jgi:hypothetical protein
VTMIASSHFNGRRTALVLTCLVALSAAGCGSVNFLGSFPADRRLACATDGHLIRAVHFTFNLGGDHGTGNRADSGQVTVTFGDEVDSFDVPGAFICSDMKHTTRPSGTITVTFAPSEAARRQYRELVRRVRAAGKAGSGASIPDELPSRVQFTGQFTNGPHPLVLTSEPFGRGEFPRDPTTPAKKD